MAFFARSSESSLMGIVSSVAPVAAGWRPCARDMQLLMAQVTLQSLVRSRQRVAGLAVVIEAPACPAIGVVAARAVRAEPA